MNLIKTSDLVMIARLAYLLKPTGEMDGMMSNAKNCHLSINTTGLLEVSLTDSVFYYISRLPTQGKSTPWDEALLTEHVKIAFSRLNRLRAKQTQKTSKRQRAGDDEFTLDVTPKGDLELASGKVRISLPLRKMVNPFPTLEIPVDDTSWTTISFGQLRHLLEFLARRPGKQDPTNKYQKCTLFRDNLAMSVVEGVTLLAHNYDLCTNTAKQLPFDIHVTLHNAKRVLDWLDMLKKHHACKETLREVRVATLKLQGADYYCIRDSNDTHLVCFPTLADGIERKRRDVCYNAPIYFSAIVGRKVLYNTLFLLEKVERAKSVVCTFRCDVEKKWHLQISDADDGEMKMVYNELPVGLVDDPPAATMSLAWNVNAKKLRLALARHDSNEVILAFQRSGNLLNVRHQYHWAADPTESPYHECVISADQCGDDAAGSSEYSARSDEPSLAASPIAEQAADGISRLADGQMDDTRQLIEAALMKEEKSVQEGSAENSPKGIDKS